VFSNGKFSGTRCEGVFKWWSPLTVGGEEGFCNRQLEYNWLHIHHRPIVDMAYIFYDCVVRMNPARDIILSFLCIVTIIQLRSLPLQVYHSSVKASLNVMWITLSRDTNRLHNETLESWLHKYCIWRKYYITSDNGGVTISSCAQKLQHLSLQERNHVCFSTARNLTERI
jgi:hypothetical protein